MVSEELAATIILRRVSRAFPKFWKRIETYRAEYASRMPWPAWCFAPTILTWAYIQELRTGRRASDLRDVGMAAEDLTAREAAGDQDAAHLKMQIPLVAALAAWRPTQGVYRFDPDVLDAILETPLQGDIPGDILEHLPEWCVYVDVGERSLWGRPIVGFFAFLECNAFTLGLELLIVPVGAAPSGEIGSMSPLVYKVTGTIDESIAAIARLVREQHRIEHRRDAIEQMREGAVLINPVLYLCSAVAEIRDRSGKEQAPRTPRGRKDRIVGAHEPTTWEVGYRLGAALRAAQGATGDESEAGSAVDRGPIGHVRRAHWHTYWTGPKSDPERRARQLRWLPPIPVNLDSDDELIPVVRRVD